MVISNLYIIHPHNINNVNQLLVKLIVGMISIVLETRPAVTLPIKSVWPSCKHYHNSGIPLYTGYINLGAL